jgi:hypothetical protein
MNCAMDSRNTLYSSFECDAYHCASEVVLSIAGTDDVLAADRLLGQLLDECLTPRTADGHVAHVTSTLRDRDAATVKTVVDACIAAGLLQTVVSGSRGDDADRAESLDCLAIPTCDKPEYLRRCLESYRAHFDEHGREVSIVVVDGSRTAAGASSTKSIARSANRGRANVTYAGPGERQELRRRSTRAGVDPDVVEWLLPDAPPHYAAGATRNVALLATAGRRVLTVDDDTVCSLREHPERQPGIAFVGHTDVRESTWFSNRRDSTAGGVASDLDLAAAHGAGLGQRLTDLRRFDEGLQTPAATSRARLPRESAMFLVGGRRRLCLVLPAWNPLSRRGDSRCPRGRQDSVRQRPNQPGSVSNAAAVECHRRVRADDILRRVGQHGSAAALLPGGVQRGWPVRVDAACL